MALRKICVYAQDYLKIRQIQRELRETGVEDAPGAVAERAFRLRVDVVHLCYENGRKRLRILRKGRHGVGDDPDAEEALKSAKIHNWKE